MQNIPVQPSPDWVATRRVHPRQLNADASIDLRTDNAKSMAPQRCQGVDPLHRSDNVQVNAAGAFGSDLRTGVAARSRSTPGYLAGPCRYGFAAAVP